MEHLIDKDALVAEIDRIVKEETEMFNEQCQGGYEPSPSPAVVCMRMEKLRSFLNTLEAKEVDLEDSIKETLAQKYIDYIFRRHDIDPESKEGMLIYYAYMHGMNQCLDKLKAQKGEE